MASAGLADLVEQPDGGAGDVEGGDLQAVAEEGVVERQTADEQRHLAFLAHPQVVADPAEIAARCATVGEGRLAVLPVRMNPDLTMASLLKKTDKANLFMVFGEPDLEVTQAEGKITGRSICSACLASFFQRQSHIRMKSP